MFTDLKFFICDSIDKNFREKFQELIRVEGGTILQNSNISSIFEHKKPKAKPRKARSRKKSIPVPEEVPLIIPTTPLEIREPIFITKSLNFKNKYLQEMYDFNIFHYDFILGKNL